MANAYALLSTAHRERSDAMAAAAADAASGAIGATLARAAVAAIASVRTDRKRGAISEPAADLRDLRTDPAMQTAKRIDCARAGVDALRLIVDAIVEGYEHDATERSAIVVAESTGVRIAVSLAQTERNDLADFPIAGHSPRELADGLRDGLGRAIDECIALPLSGLLDAATLPPALYEVGRRHGERVGRAVREAYYAGTRAAMTALLRAIAAARG